jgi:hypothetical protein
VLGLAEVVECGGRDARLWINRIAKVESSDIGAFASERNRAIEPACGAPENEYRWALMARYSRARAALQQYLPMRE